MLSVTRITAQGGNGTVPGAKNRSRKTRVAGATLALLLIAGLPLLGGCDDSYAREFRSAANSSIQQGVNAILDGVVSGVFAVLEPEPQSNTNG